MKPLRRVHNILRTGSCQQSRSSRQIAGICQIWIFPDKTGLNPTYDQKSFAPNAWRNRLLAVASGQNLPGAVTFHTDAAIYRCELDKGMNVTLEPADDWDGQAIRG